MFEFQLGFVSCRLCGCLYACWHVCVFVCSYDCLDGILMLPVMVIIGDPHA